VIWPFKPHAPLPLASKVTCERRFAAVGRMLGRDRIATPAAITPLEFDPIIKDCEAEELLTRVFGFIANRILRNTATNVEWGDDAALTVEDRTFVYRIVEKTDNPSAILFHSSLAAYPYRLAAIAATAASEYLIRSESLAASIPKGAFEVLPTFFGFGPLMANAALHESSEELQLWHINNWSRNGEVSSLEHGYTMALADWSLSSSYEAVLGQLRLDAQEGLRKGIRFLTKTSDCSLAPDFLNNAPDLSTSTCIARLQARGSSVQLATVLDVHAQERITEDLIPAVAGLLNHSELDIQQIATATLGRCENLAQPLHDELLIQSQNGPITLRRAAISALRPGYENDDSVQDVLTEILFRSDAATATACVRTFLKYETHPENLADAVLAALTKMVLTAGTAELVDGLTLLGKVHSDRSQVINETFNDDPSALAIFNEILESDSSTEETPA
jgi:hypothetical protein